MGNIFETAYIYKKITRLLLPGLKNKQKKTHNWCLFAKAISTT